MCIMKINLYGLFCFDITAEHHCQSQRLKDTIKHAANISLQIQLYNKYFKYISAIHNIKVKCHGQNVAVIFLICSYLSTQGGNDCTETPAEAIRAFSFLQVTGAQQFQGKQKKHFASASTRYYAAAWCCDNLKQLRLCTRNVFVMLGLIIA